MIFYFTGTGNSYAAALQLQLRLGDEIANITECVQEKKYSFEIKNGESVGIVCPVYYGGLPSIVVEFLNEVQFGGDPDHIYGVLTCGGTEANAGGMLRKLLKQRGYDLSACWIIKMPANYAILYEPTKEEAVGPILEKAGDELEEIIGRIKKREKMTFSTNPVKSIMTSIMYPMYEKARTTKGFYTDDQCIGCGVCAGRCPVKAIEMIDHKPVWVKDKCVFCMSCVRCGAIQYKDKMIGRRRYRHPVFEKKKKAACH